MSKIICTESNSNYYKYFPLYSPMILRLLYSKVLNWNETYCKTYSNKLEFYVLMEKSWKRSDLKQVFPFSVLHIYVIFIYWMYALHMSISSFPLKLYWSSLLTYLRIIFFFIYLKYSSFFFFRRIFKFYSNSVSKFFHERWMISMQLTIGYTFNNDNKTASQMQLTMKHTIKLQTSLLMSLLSWKWK